MGSVVNDNFVFVLAPGAWHKASCFDKLSAALLSRGHEAEAVEYPTVGAEPPTKHMSEDAEAIRAAILRHADAGKKIVLVVHSYGGVAGAEAVKGLGWATRAKEGLPGGVVQFVYLAAFVTPKETSIKDMLGGQLLPWIKPEGNYVRVEDPTKIFYHDVSPTDLAIALRDLQHQSLPVFADTTSFEPWAAGSDIECSYIVCEEDQALLPPVQEHMATLLPKGSYVARLKASHSPFLSLPEETAQLLERAGQAGWEKIM